MAVIVDDEPLAAEKMGFKTIGQVLSHVRQRNRLVVNLLIDGKIPDLAAMATVRQSPLNGRTIYIETAEPRAMALGVLGEVEEQLDASEKLKGEAIGLLQQNQPERAMEKLSGWLHAWYTAQDSISKIGQLMGTELDALRVEGRALSAVLAEFAGQLRGIKAAIENRDFVTLGDILAYETNETADMWRAVLGSLRSAVSVG
jgi:hypothetical protein